MINTVENKSQITECTCLAHFVFCQSKPSSLHRSVNQTNPVCQVKCTVNVMGKSSVSKGHTEASYCVPLLSTTCIFRHLLCATLNSVREALVANQGIIT